LQIAGVDCRLPEWVADCRSGLQIAGAGCRLPEWVADCRSGLQIAGVDCGTLGSFLHARASERYLKLGFGFNLSQGCSGVGTRGNGVPTPLFLTLRPWL